MLSFQSLLKVKKAEDTTSMVYDPVRRKYVRSTPEEIVRQLWISYFIETQKVNPKLIAIERAFSTAVMNRRFDLVIFDKTTHPVLLAEFKAPGIKNNQVTFDQISVYNMHLHIPFTLVSNGIEHFCFHVDQEKKGFTFLEKIPSLRVD